MGRFADCQWPECSPCNFPHSPDTFKPLDCEARSVCAAAPCPGIASRRSDERRFVPGNCISGPCCTLALLLQGRGGGAIPKVWKIRHGGTQTHRQTKREMRRGQKGPLHFPVRETTCVGLFAGEDLGESLAVPSRGTQISTMYHALGDDGLQYG